MQFDDFKRIVTTFADENKGVEIQDNYMLLEIRGRVVEAGLLGGPDGIKVRHEGEAWTAERWIRSYLAKLDRLAERIIDYVSPPENYVSPKVDLLDWKDKPIKSDSSLDSSAELRKNLTDPSVGKTSIYFLTSDAGEGKTSLIEKISVEQALAFKNKKADALILPVSLGGRSFLRFDDVVIAALMNKLRFPYLYYDSFLELIRMDAIIPAFDGFEEVLVDVKSGEALSAIGNLVSQLSSTGTLLVAARKAYFESSLNSQAKLLDSIRPKQDVEIHRFVLNRWNRDVFLKYAHKRKVRTPGKLYDRVKKRLRKKDHPVLTRAVLVRRLIDVAKQTDNLNEFLQRLGHSEVNYFFDFVESIVKREANEKWVNRSGTDSSPLLTLEEHHELLSQLALEMCINSVDVLKSDVIELVVEFFAEEKDMNPDVQRQIARRILDHSLLRKDESQGSKRRVTRVRFDHEDFQEFYLGQALARALSTRDSADARLILDARALTQPEIREATRYLGGMSKKGVVSIDELLGDLQQLSQREQWVSYTRENCGALMLELVQHAKQFSLISKMNFPASALQDRKLRNLKISHSFFSSTSLDKSEIIGCEFDKCRFAELIINQGYKLNDTVFNNCDFDSIVIYGSLEGDRQAFFNPDRVRSILKSRDFNLESSGKVISEDIVPQGNDRDMEIALRFMRMFNRATTVNKTVIRTRFGKKSGHFFNNILPELQRAYLVESTKSDKFRLMVPLSQIDELFDSSENTFREFVKKAQNRELIESTS